MLQRFSAGATLPTINPPATVNNTPPEIVCDQGGQCVDPIYEGKTHFQKIVELLGIPLRVL
jgi:hypothetical protein